MGLGSFSGKLKALSTWSEMSRDTIFAADFIEAKS